MARSWRLSLQGIEPWAETIRASPLRVERPRFTSTVLHLPEAPILPGVESVPGATIYVRARTSFRVKKVIRQLHLNSADRFGLGLGKDRIRRWTAIQKSRTSYCHAHRKCDDDKDNLFLTVHVRHALSGGFFLRASSCSASS